MPDDDFDDDREDDSPEAEPRGRSRRLGERYADVELGPPPIAPDGGIVPMPLPAPAPLPPRAPDTFVCLRGPCRHYMRTETAFPIGNPAGTFGGATGLRDPLTGELVREPRQIAHACLVQPGVELDLTDDHVYACNQWDPLVERRWWQWPATSRTARRSRYLALYPNHKD